MCVKAVTKKSLVGTHGYVQDAMFCITVAEIARRGTGKLWTLLLSASSVVIHHCNRICCMYYREDHKLICPGRKKE